MEDITLTFGKHRGKHLSEVPVDYVRWLSEQSTIMGKTDIPAAAKAFLAHSTSNSQGQIEQPLKYALPKTLQEARKLSWMAEKGNPYVAKEARRTMLAARNPIDHYLKVFDGDDEYEIYDLVLVRDDGTCTDVEVGILQAIVEDRIEVTAKERQNAAETLKRYGFLVDEIQHSNQPILQPVVKPDDEALFDENRRRGHQRDIQGRDRKLFINAIWLVLGILRDEFAGKFSKRCEGRCREMLLATNDIEAGVNQRYQDEIILIALRIADVESAINSEWRSTKLDQAVIDAFVEQGKKERW